MESDERAEKMKQLALEAASECLKIVLTRFSEPEGGVGADELIPFIETAIQKGYDSGLAEGMKRLAEAACKEQCGYCYDGFPLYRVASDFAWHHDLGKETEEHVYSPNYRECKANSVRRAAAALGVILEEK